VGRPRHSDLAARRPQESVHIAGSDASGIVWACGAKVRRWKVGDEVIVHCNQDDGDDEDCNGGDPLLSPSQAHLGIRDAGWIIRAVLPRAVASAHAEAAAPHLGGGGLLHAHARDRLSHAVRPFAAHVEARRPRAGVGRFGRPRVFGVQLAAASGANAIGIISDESKRDYVMQLGAKGVINRKDFSCWGQMPTVGTPEYDTWVKEARKFGKAIWDITGKRDVDIVFEHPGEATFPVSCLVVKRGGMVVFCAGPPATTSPSTRVMSGCGRSASRARISPTSSRLRRKPVRARPPHRPCMSEVFPWTKIPHAHELMRTNRHPPGNMAVLVNAPRTGLRTLDDVIEASGAPA
jgi:crotonyl-CoA carboxylase/reductase